MPTSEAWNLWSPDMAKPPTPYGLNSIRTCLDCLTKQSNLFCQLPVESLRELSSLVQTSFYPQGALLFVEGESPRGVFILCLGKAKLDASSKEGKIITLRVVESGEVLGLSSVIANTPYAATAVTLTSSRVCFIPQPEFLRFLRSHAEVSFRVSEHLSMELHKAWEQARLLGLAPNTRAKLAQLILDWAEQHGTATSEGVRVPVHMTQEEIGEAIGTSRETVSRLLADFRRRRVIRVKGGSVLVIRPEELRALGAS